MESQTRLADALDDIGNSNIERAAKAAMRLGAEIEKINLDVMWENLADLHTEIILNKADPALKPDGLHWFVELGYLHADIAAMLIQWRNRQAEMGTRLRQMVDEVEE